MSTQSQASAAVSLERIATDKFTASLDALSVDELVRLADLATLSEDHARALSAYLVARARKLVAPAGTDISLPEAPGPGARARRPASQIPKQIAGQLKTWWQRSATQVSARRTLGRKGGGIQVAIDKTPPAAAAVWNAKRLGVLQSVWGEGFLEPGGAPFAKKFTGLAKVNSSQTVLDLTAGLGGTAAHTTKREKLWMEALEPDRELAGKAREFVNSWALGKRLKMGTQDFENLQLPTRRYDLVYSRERFFTFENKKDILRHVANSLKADGSLLLLDFLAPTPDEHADELKDWARSEPARPFAWTPQFYRQALEHFGFTVNFNQDITSEYVDLINKGWLKAIKLIDSGDLDPETAGYLSQNGEMWLTRAKLMDTGVIRVHKIHAILANASDPE